MGHPDMGSTQLIPTWDNLAWSKFWEKLIASMIGYYTLLHLNHRFFSDGDILSCFFIHMNPYDFHYLINYNNN